MFLSLFTFIFYFFSKEKERKKAWNWVDWVAVLVGRAWEQLWRGKHDQNKLHEKNVFI